MQTLDHNILLDGSVGDVAKYLCRILEAHDEADINKELLRAVQAQLVPPGTIKIWLSITRSAQSVKEALTQEYSILVRQSAIRSVGKYLRTSRWRDVWYMMGDDAITAWCDLLSRVSVLEVEQLTKAIGDSFGYQDEDKTREVTELFYSLSNHPSRSPRPVDQGERPLPGRYFNLLPSCTNACVEEALSSRATPAPLRRQLVYSHTSLLEQLSIDSKLDLRRLVPNIDDLLTEVSITSMNEPGFTSSMKFSFSVLQDFVSSAHQSGINTFNPSIVKLIDSLTRRALEKRSPRLREIISLGIEAYAKVSLQKREVSYSNDGFLFDIVRAWGGLRCYGRRSNTSTEEFEPLLKEALCLLKPRALDAGSYDLILSKVRRNKRFQLLRIIVQAHFGVDIHDKQQLDGWDCRRLSAFTFLLLEPEPALSFLRNLSAARPKCDFIDLHSSTTLPDMPFFPIYVSPEPSGRHVDCTMLQVHVSRGEFGATQLAEEKIQELKALAAKSRERPNRSHYAQSVILYAALSRSLSIFADALIWGRRFLRDPLTARELYSSNGIAAQESIDLLSGMPESRRDELLKLDLTALQSRIASSNEIMLSLLETMLQAHREPSFDSNGWYRLTTTFVRVVDERALRSTWLEANSDYSPDEIYHAIWPATIQLLVEIEGQFLQPGREDLDYFDSCGVLRAGPLSVPDSKYGLNVIRFYDDLAEARNEMWSKHRARENATIAEVPEPFPQGLPIQCLNRRGHICDGLNSKTSPYLTSRAQQIVFMRLPDMPAQTLPGKPEKAVIGSFIDSLSVATEIYILQDQNKQRRKERMEAVWSHWTDLLCKQKQVSTEEAQKYLHQQLKDKTSLQDLKLPEPHQRDESYPLRPSASSQDDITEWDPTMNISVDRAENSYPPLSTDCFVQAESWSCLLVNEEFKEPSEWTNIEQVFPLLSTERALSGKKYLNGAVAEGLVLAALLTLDSMKKEGQRLLQVNFPAEGNSRYPATYLDTTFTDQKDVTQSRAYNVLANLITRVPPKLLECLARHYFKTLDSIANPSELASAEYTAYRLLKLLIRSDKPELAFPLIQQAILDRPEASSWHRQVLTPLLGRRLSVSAVSTFFSGFARGVIERLENQTTASVSSENNQRPPIVKITTVKMLAQLLQTADYIAASTAADILGQLLTHSSHIDVRAAVVDSLLSRLSSLGQGDSKELTEKLISTLELVVPVAGAFNERKPMSKDDFAQLEGTLTVPDTFSNDGNEDQPISTKLIEVDVPAHLQKEFYHRVIGPAVDLSMAENLRVVHLVLKKQNFDIDMISAVMPFTCPNAVKLFQKYYLYLPRQFFLSFRSMIVANLQPQEPIKKVTAFFNSSNSLVTSSEARIWRRFFDLGKEVPNVFVPLPALLKKDWKSSTNTDCNIEIELIQFYILEQAEALMNTSEDPDLTLWDQFLHHLEPPSPRGSYDENVTNTNIWSDNVRAILQVLLTHITTVRTSGWQGDTSRRPPVLPPELILHVWLIPGPEQIKPETPGEGVKFLPESLRHYANSILNVLTDHLDLTMTNPQPALDKVIAAAHRTTHGSFFELDCHLGILAEEKLRTSPAALSMSEPSQLLRIHDGTIICVLVVVKVSEFIKRRLRAAVARQEGLDDAEVLFRELVEKWRKSEHEEVRMQGMRLEKVFPDQHRGQ